MGSVLKGSDDSSWLNSDVVWEGVYSEVPCSVVCIFLFLRRLGVASRGKGGNISFYVNYEVFQGVLP